MPADKLLERINHALRTGEWWVPAWWQSSHYFESEHLVSGEVERAFLELQQIFDKEWFLSQAAPCPASSLSHSVANLLLVEGLYPFHSLVRLGHALSAVRGATLLDTELITRLRHPDQYPGAHFELEMLAHLLQGRFTVERHSEGTGDQRADFYVTNGSEEVVLELNRRTAEFPHALAQENLELYEEAKLESISQIFTCEKFLRANQAAWQKETKRVFRLIKDKINTQLPSEKPGVIIFQPTLPLNLRWLQDSISHYGQSYKYFLGVILIAPRFSEGAICFSLELLPNDHAQRNMRDFLAVREILRIGSTRNDC